jgi:hypothetical protein
MNRDNRIKKYIHEHGSITVNAESKNATDFSTRPRYESNKLGFHLRGMLQKGLLDALKIKGRWHYFLS